MMPHAYINGQRIPSEPASFPRGAQTSGGEVILSPVDDLAAAFSSSSHAALDAAEKQ